MTAPRDVRVALIAAFVLVLARGVNAAPLSPGVPARAMIPPGDTEQKAVTYEFGPGISGPVVVDAASTTIDTTLRVWRRRPDDSEFLAGEDDNRGVGSYSRFAFTAREDERYRIVVRPTSISWCGGVIETVWRHGGAPALDNEAAKAAEAAYWLAAEQAAAAGGPICVIEQRIRRGCVSPPRGVDPESQKAAAEETVAMAERAVGVSHPLYARSLWALADTVDVGSVKEAEKTYARAIAIVETSLGPDHPALLPILNSLGDTLETDDEHAKAQAAFQRAVDIATKAYGPGDPVTAVGLHGLGLHYYRLSENTTAKALLARSLSIFEVAYGPDHPKVAKSSHVLALVLNNLGEYAASKALLERALAIDEAAPDAEPGMIGEHLAGLGLLAMDMGDYPAALPWLERALAVIVKTTGEDSSSQPFYNLGIYYSETGEFNRARTMYEKAMAIDTAQHGPDHSYVAEDMVKLAWTYRELGDADQSVTLCRRALTIQEKAFGAESPRLSETLGALGNALLLSGDLGGARSVYERAIANMEKADGPDAIDLCVYLDNLASVADRQGRYTESVALRTRALAIADKVGNEKYALDVRQNLAERDVATGDLAGAKALIETTQATLAKMPGEQPSKVASNLVLLSRTLWGLGDTRGGFAAGSEAARISRDHTRLMLRNLPERQALRYGEQGREGLDVLLSIAVSPGSPPGAATSAFDAVIRARAIVLDEISARHRSIVTAGDPETATLARAFTDGSRRLAALILRDADGELSDTERKQIEDLRTDREKTERALAERSASFRAEIARERFGYEDLASHLPEGSAVVSYVEYQRHTWTKATRPGMKTVKRVETTAPAMAAFVSGGNGVPVALVPIGSRDEIDALVRRWHEEASRGAFRAGRTAIDAEQAYREAGDALRRKIWDPVAAVVGNAKRVFVVPDGSLQLASLAALPDKGGAYLVERAPIQYLSAERDLAVAAAETGVGSALIVGGPSFDDTATFASLVPKAGGTGAGADVAALPMVAAVFRGSRSGCAGFRTLRFGPLPGTDLELEDVTRSWSPGPVTPLRGASATEAAFKADAPGKRLLHLSTHGWFLGGECEAASAGTRAVGGLTASDALPAPALAENPLLLSGLALAGANHRDAAGPDEEDGILTAEEIAAMDLSSVDWAVLSACDTGVGEIKAGEGVLGLRRAFQVAGARTLIMSLWSVDDDATRSWMESLYEGRLASHLDTADAVRHASLAVLGERRAKKLSTHPFYWAGFVAAGDWR